MINPLATNAPLKGEYSHLIPRLPENLRGKVVVPERLRVVGGKGVIDV